MACRLILVFLYRVPYVSLVVFAGLGGVMAVGGDVGIFGPSVFWYGGDFGAVCHCHLVVGAGFVFERLVVVESARGVTLVAVFVRDSD